VADKNSAVETGIPHLQPYDFVITLYSALLPTSGIEGHLTMSSTDTRITQRFF